jgi:NADH:ubiquinone oxidoreductase subunit 5 (subunit L)/multisubunit Na+/H+ antiporter MnhA subunit
MFLDYLALVLLIGSITMVFYTFIYIHDLPHKIAKAREHPHEESIHVACWLSLLTLHAMWPIVFIWAVSHKKQPHPSTEPIPQSGPNGELTNRLAVLEERLRKLEGTAK